MFTERYNRRAPRCLWHLPDVREVYRKNLLLQEANPHHRSLPRSGRGNGSVPVTLSPPQ